MNKLRVLRRKAGISQTQLAVRAGINPSQLNRIEKGVRPNRRTAERLAAALGLKAEIAFPGIEKLRQY